MHKRMRVEFLAGAILLLIGAASGSPVNLLTNGSFETGDFTGWTQTPASSGSSFGVSNAVGPLEGPESGSYYAFFGSDSGMFDTITQTIPTIPGHIYLFSVWATATSANDGTNEEFQVLWQGVPRIIFINSGTPIFLFL